MIENLSSQLIENILDHLPVEISFVDNEDTVRYYSYGDKRIFKRTPAVIGKKVQNCHPSQSVYKVQQIVDDFKSGNRSLAEFWINLHGRVVLIRYFAVRDKENNYQGVLEVTQDITDIKKIEGEKRLLDG
jgi:PAS domain S-box-containing protein